EHPLFRSAATTFTRDPALTEAIWREVSPRVLGVEVSGQHAFPEAAEVLAATSRHAGIGVIANQYRTVRDVLRREGLDAFFRVLQISEEAGSRNRTRRFSSGPCGMRAAHLGRR